MRLVAMAVLALVFVPAAWAGGWSTVGLRSTPDGLAPGEPWNAEFTVLAHGVTPLNDVKPTLTISNGAVSRTFAATRASRPGTYRATVVFPTAGTWRYSVHDGYLAGVTHTFPPATIRAGAPVVPRAEGGTHAWLAIPGAACLFAALALVVRDRRRQPQAA
jgi:hypothetical protein